MDKVIRVFFFFFMAKKQQEHPKPSKVPSRPNNSFANCQLPLGN